ncbi:CAAX amino terminal protease self- immunity [Clostridium homopropionicum DSM 5847]|uniref:CAAX amino terminal protease self-immunity n=1 Tax=Clostridium homopropionicum DSM 5847 TaxID=1121318 RepID=A0A0L6ZAN3_9CLOT|nr:CPBP family glutamic-type intramembrane protease [Clostridium homopropionicum]KOA20030.1 CAAX amino terminal protease self- immunity [Clostridium homopropionicum DSM 5847]SFG65225.1 CAAX protease self-immunity [Clostridium homopropionicum]
MKTLNKTDLKVSLIFTAIGILAGVFLGLFQIDTIKADPKQMEIVLKQLPSLELLVVVSMLQTGLYAFLCSFSGLKLARKVNLGSPMIESLFYKHEKKIPIIRSGIIASTVIGILSAVLIAFSDKFIFQNLMPQIKPSAGYVFSPVYFFGSVLYGGIIEEVIMRLFFISLIVFGLNKLFANQGNNSIGTILINWGAILLAALLFAAGHLPATGQLLGLSTITIIRSFVLNGLAGIGFGWLYWRKGFEYAVIAHMLTHMVNQLILMHILY